MGILAWMVGGGLSFGTDYFHVWPERLVPNQVKIDLGLVKEKPKGDKK